LRALYVYSSNPAAVCPNQTLVLEGLAREDLFTVVHEQVLTDTAYYADLVLPATTSMEHLDLYRSYGQFTLQLARPVLPPQGQAKSNWEVFQLLARAMGVGQDHYAKSPEALIREFLAKGDETVRGITFEELAAGRRSARDSGRRRGHGRESARRGASHRPGDGRDAARGGRHRGDLVAPPPPGGAWRERADERPRDRPGRGSRVPLEPGGSVARIMRTLFLHPPSYEGFDGGAGSRYQARREVRSFWYPTWLAQPAALVPGSRLVDAPPDGLTLEDVRPLARDYELAVLHTSTPSFPYDVRVAEALKAENPRLRVGFVGAHVAVDPEASLAASPAIDFVARGEFDFTIQEVAQGHPLGRVLGLSYRDDGGLRHTPDRPTLENMDALPFVVEVYKRDLTIENYVIGYLLHPYVSLYTGRGCRSRCTFCLWPQTVGGHRYRTRPAGHV